MVSLPHNNQKGASAVEFAIVFPFLAVLLFGIIDFSLLFYNKQVLTNASRELARFAIVKDDHETSLSDQEDIIKKFCSDHLINLGGSSDPHPQVSFDKPTVGYVTVIIKYSYTYFFATAFEALGLDLDDVELSGRTVMRDMKEES